MTSISNPSRVGGPPPIAIGGVGGSGTRLVAELLRSAGVHLGDDLNSASDTLWFTLLFKRAEVTLSDSREMDLLTDTLVAGLRRATPLSGEVVQMLHALASRDRPQHSADWLQARAVSLAKAAAEPALRGHWGWKEPNTHVVIERLWERMPTLRYIHVVRHGVDMAYSSNQNQLQLWGEQVLGADGHLTPQRSLAYWCRVHQRMQDLQQQNRARMYWLDYDNLCRDPVPALSQLFAFLEFSDAQRAAVVRNPMAIRAQPARHLLHGTDDLDKNDLAYVGSLGYAL